MPAMKQEQKVERRREQPGWLEDPAGANDFTEQEKAMIDLTANAMIQHLLKEAREPYLKLLRSGESGMPPTQVVGTVVAMLAQKAESVVGLPPGAGDPFGDPALKEEPSTGDKLDPAILFTASAITLDKAVDMGEKAGLLRFRNEQEEERFMAEAADVAINHYLQQGHAAGTIDSEAAARDMAPLIEGQMRRPPMQNPVAAGVGQAVGAPPEGPAAEQPLLAAGGMA